MPFVSITRLRIRSLRFVPAFAVYAMRTSAQVRRAPGFLGGAVLSDHAFAFWTMTLWERQEDMRAYMTDGAHLKAMPKLMHWCDEASVVHWHQATQAPPAWPEADRRMRSEGRPSKVRHPTRNHADLSYRPPRTTGATSIVPR